MNFLALAEQLCIKKTSDQTVTDVTNIINCMLGGRKYVINYNHSYVCYISKVYYRGSGNELILSYIV